METMSMRTLSLYASSAVIIGAFLAQNNVALAQDRAAELLGLHQLCDHGDRKACVRFGMMLGENKERHAEWRKAHPEFWWWER